MKDEVEVTITLSLPRLALEAIVRDADSYKQTVAEYIKQVILDRTHKEQRV
jgi:hypothetical protein